MSEFGFTPFLRSWIRSILYISYMLKYYFIQLLSIVVIIVSIINFLYTFGYQGEPMSQVEFLSRTLGSIIFGSISFLQLMKNKKPPKVN